MGLSWDPAVFLQKKGSVFPTEQTRGPIATSLTSASEQCNYDSCSHHISQSTSLTVRWGPCPVPWRGRACRLSPPSNMGLRAGGGRGEGNRRPVIEVAWNNKYTHSLLNMARHILGNLEKCSTLPPQHPAPPSPPTAVCFHAAWRESMSL